MEILNFRGDLFSRKYLSCEYRENQSLTKLNRFKVLAILCFRLGGCEFGLWHAIPFRYLTKRHPHRFAIRKAVCFFESEKVSVLLLEFQHDDSRNIYYFSCDFFGYK